MNYSAQLCNRLNNAEPHEVIEVKSGEWDVSNCIIKSPVTIIGGHRTVLKAPNKSGTADKYAFSFQGGGYLHVERIIFQNYNVHKKAAAILLLPDDAKRIRIIDCEFHDCKTGVKGGFDKVAKKERCEDIELSGLYIRDATFRGIDIHTPFKSCVVRNSIVDGANQGAMWLGVSKYGIHRYESAAVSGCEIRNVHAEKDCKAVMIAATVGTVSGNHFADVGVTEGAKHYSDSCSAYFKSERATASDNRFDRACGVVGKRSCDLTVSGNVFWTDIDPDEPRSDLTRWSTGAIATSKNASVLAYGNRMWGMVIALASRQRSYIHHNIFRDVPLVKPWNRNEPMAIFYEKDVKDFHSIHHNTVENGVLEVYRHGQDDDDDDDDDDTT